MDLAAYFTPDDFARGALQERWGTVLAFAGLVLDTALLWQLTFGKIGKRLQDGCTRIAAAVPAGGVAKILGPEWLSGALFLGLVAIVRAIVALPIDLGRHALALNLGTSHEGWGSFVGHEALEALVVAVGFCLLGAALGAIRRRSPKRWWLAVGVVAGALLFVDAVTEPLWLRMDFTPKPMAPGPLRSRLERLIQAHSAGFHDITVVDASRYGTRANALATGLGPTLQIVVTDTLLDFGDEAVAGAVAHEIGHRRVDRLPLRLAFAAFALVLFLWLVERGMAFAQGRGARDSAHTLPFVLACTSVLLTVLAPARAAFGRDEEREADALELANRHDYDAYVAEIVKLVRANASAPEPTGWNALVSDHPSAAERIARAIEHRDAR